MEKNSDSHLSQGGHAETPPGPLKQHQRLARGEKVTGQTNPNGAGPTTASRLAGETKNY